MRITNTMILNSSASNINSTKNLLDKTNTQMTNQQKISRPSEDPIIAVRSLRLQTALSKTDQYYNKNIPDATAWLEVTETALTNIKDIMTDIRTLCVQGSTETLNTDNLNTILTQLKNDQKEIFSEGNADNAGRTVFTGFRTNKNLTFMENEKETTYSIDQTLNASDMSKLRYYANGVDVPSTPTEALALNNTNKAGMTVEKSEYNRLSLGYNKITGVGTIDFGTRGTVDLSSAANATAQSVTGGDGSIGSVYIFDNESEWETWSKTQGTAADPVNTKYVGDKDVVVIKSTGDLIFGEELAQSMQSDGSSISLNYTKKGFEENELRPEYYYNCRDITDPANTIEYKKFDEDGNPITYDINYTIANNQTMAVNTEASEVFDSSIYQDVNDMIDAVQFALDAHKKLDKIKAMMDDSAYAAPDVQAKLSEWKELAQKEADFADDNINKLFSTELANADKYLDRINLGITRLGCTRDQLEMTEKRMSEQEATLEDLQSQNDDLDLSQIIIDYTAVYTAYQSSLTAAGRLYQQTLLNYI